MSLKKLGLVAAAVSLIATSLFSLGAQAAPEAKSVYIVKFADNASLANEIAAVKKSGIAVNDVLEFAFKGFIGEMTSAQALALSKNPRVDFVEADAPVYATETQTGATWGIDRIDQQSRPLSGTYNYQSTGSGVTAYVIDTGIYVDNDEFGGRASLAYNTTGDGQETDCNGHGTHVAGTIGGKTYGVAKSVTLIGVKVLGCSGSGFTSGVVAGVDWVAANKKLPAVANMSLGGGASNAIDTAVAKLVASGVTVAVAAGNSNQDACRFSPARVSTAITVGATTNTDARASYSNYGTCLDIFAPGSGITSSWFGSKTATNTISGTSMATPHVAGVAARYLSNNPPSTLPADVAQALITGSSTSKVTSAGKGSPNRLLFMNSGS